MKAAWVRPGGPRIPDGNKLKKYGIDTLYWEARDPVLSSAFLDEMRKYVKVGIMRDPSWGTGTNALFTPQSFAQKLSDDLVALNSTNKQLYVMADIEYHDAEWVGQWLTAWRRLRPTRVTNWTLEPNQGGWITPDLANKINFDPNLQVLPQAYFGDMAPAVESQIAMNVEAAGIRWERIKCFYSPADLPRAWDGAVFGFTELP